MTREEAIKTIRLTCPKISDSECDFETAMRFLIPELAESEDEKMCTRCIELLRKVSAYSGEEYLGVEIVDCIIGLQALRKKLKESLYIPETCKENPDSFTDADEKIRKFLVNLVNDGLTCFPDSLMRSDVLAWLEKQKENHKNAISIPADCASNAKCPYKIHGEGEFIGDIKDSPAYWRGWDDAMKQKEQKPVAPSDDELQRHQDELYNFKVFASKRAKEHHISFVHDFEWNNFCASLLTYLEVNKPVEWSEEDEKCYKELIHHFESLSGCLATEERHAENRRWLSFLRSLRPSWKPSEEQMRALEECGECKRCVKELYEQLKKLM